MEHFTVQHGTSLLLLLPLAKGAAFLSTPARVSTNTTAGGLDKGCREASRVEINQTGAPVEKARGETS